MGEPPLTYLAWWRMTTAGRLLRHDDLCLRQIAERTGYSSESPSPRPSSGSTAWRRDGTAEACRSPPAPSRQLRA
ncbi:hypothetical protein [Streptomyces sp. NPDC052107]|uniref:hypothetical protein n=1 Tax=Streptomyces sp. NPDC052107 TaxID=3155632 RepID=UPI003437623C